RLYPGGAQLLGPFQEAAACPQVEEGLHFVCVNTDGRVHNVKFDILREETLHKWVVILGGVAGIEKTNRRHVGSFRRTNWRKYEPLHHHYVGKARHLLPCPAPRR